MSINFLPFEIGRRALLANQQGINITGQNIANVNTPGYSRQSVQFTESPASSFNGLPVGTGVTIQGVRTFRDRFIESRLQTETGVTGRLTAQRDALSPVESILQGTENSGVNAALQQFFGSFRDLEANPNSVPLRAVVAQKGENLATAFQTTRRQLSDVQRSNDGQLGSYIENVNTLSKQVATLNQQISASELNGQEASLLRDQRGELVRQISDLTGARTTENADGTINVTIGEGRALVLGNSSVNLQADRVPPNGFIQITLDGQPAVFTDGKIKGTQDAIATIGSQIQVLDDLAASVVSRVNSLHTSGTDLDGNAGTNFFNTSTPVTAANISVNTAIKGNPRLVVASPLTQPGQTGTVAGQIANLLTDQNSTVGSQTGSFSSIYGALVAQAGENVSSAENNLATQGLILSQIQSQRESISGVSLDEEAINLLQYQKGYEAAARFIKVADELTQTILSLAGN